MPAYSYAYSIPYVCLFIFVLFLFFLEIRKKTLIKERDIQRTIFVSMILFFGLRGYIYTDWATYYPFFEKVPTIWGGDILAPFKYKFLSDVTTDVRAGQKGIEIGFIYFTMIIKSFFPDYHIYVFINSIIDFVILHLFFKKHTRYYVLGFLCFLVFEGIGLEANLIRNIKAILLFLISLQYLQARKAVPYFLLNTLGYLLHSSAIIYFPLYFILHKNWSNIVYWGIFVIGLIIVLFQVNYIESILNIFGKFLGGRISMLIQLYSESDLYSKSFNIFRLSYLERVFTFILLMSFRKKMVIQNSYNQIFINLFVLYFIVYFYCSEISVLVERIPMLFVPCYWILYPNIFELLDKKKKYLIFIPTFVLFSLMKIINANSNILTKYDNLIFGIENYKSREAIMQSKGYRIINNQ